MNILKKEWYLMGFILAPLAYLGYLFKTLPNQVPIHWNLQGEIDGYGDKSMLFVVAALPLVFYLLFSLIRKFDPKQKLETMGNKFQKIKGSLVVLISILVLYMFYSIQNPDQFSINLIYAVLGLLYVILGNYFQTVKPNYFLGIRTPWTLANETVWKSTHKLAGKFWFTGGLIIVVYSLLGYQAYSLFLFVAITSILVLVPTIYSYVQYKNVKNS